jgi:hypothetical protein
MIFQKLPSNEHQNKNSYITWNFGHTEGKIDNITLEYADLIIY